MSIAQDQAPLSAIDWLSKRPSLSPYADKKDPRNGIISPPPSTFVTQIETKPLQKLEGDMIGLLSPQFSKIPTDVWQDQDALVLRNTLANLPSDLYPAARELLNRLLLSQANSSDDITLARLDTLVQNGTIQAAETMIEQLDITTPALFERYFDILMLLDKGDKSCALWRKNKELSTQSMLRVYCYTRLGDWEVADINYFVYKSLGDFSPAQQKLLAGYLEPEMIEEDENIPINVKTITPLEFHLFENIGQSIPLQALPVKFLVGNLSASAGWKFQIEAAERLSAYGAISAAHFTAIYTRDTPAASGDMWTRVKDFQKIYNTLRAQDIETVSNFLESYWRKTHHNPSAFLIAHILAPHLKVDAFANLKSRAKNEILLLAGLIDKQIVFSQNEFAWLDALLAQDTPPSSPKALDILKIIALSHAAKQGDTQSLRRAAELMAKFGFSDLAAQLVNQAAILSP